MHWPFITKKECTPKVVAEDGLLKAFRTNPRTFLRQFGSRQYDWSERPDGLRDMYFSCNGFALGYVHGMTYVPPSTIVVRHFAIGEGRSERTGLGTTLARWLRDELSKRYNITAIVFSEVSYRAHDAAFFAKLGATHSGKIDYCDQFRWDF